MLTKRFGLKRCLSALVLLAALTGLVACGGQGFADPIPPTPVDLENLALAPYTNRSQGFHSLVPEGWFVAMKDIAIFASGSPETRPGATLIQRLEAGSTLSGTVQHWLPLLGLRELPERTDQRRTSTFTWDLHAYETNDPGMGSRRGAIALAETDDGVYLVVLIALRGQYEALYQSVLLPVVDALAPVTVTSPCHQDYANWPVVASIEAVANNARRSVEFALEKCTRLRVYAIGEGDEQSMADYGFVENVATGQVVWRMYHFETESAGYPRNRLADRALSLPAGSYRLHFETNGAHAFDDWAERPPSHRFWGITLFEDQSPGAAQATCWQRASRPGELGWSPDKLKGLVPELERRNVAALMVVTNGQVVFEWGNTANNFRSHSMRKSLLSALYGIYVADGEIEPSMTLLELDINDLNPLTEAEKQATVRDLLSARSGVYIPAAAEAQSMRDDRPERGSHRPDTHWYYNNWDFNALGTIFIQQTGEDLFQAFETSIAGPLGMQDFRLDDQLYSYEYWLSMHPSYPFRISARDLARLGQLYLQEGDWQGQQIVPSTWVEESTRPISRTADNGTYSGYGYMWWIAAEDHGAIAEGSFAASGYGGHTVEVLPHLNTVIVLRVNTDDDSSPWLGSHEADEVMLTILAAREQSR
jgi:CubicO group peptidase (beta-lactamase class C family)